MKQNIALLFLMLCALQVNAQTKTKKQVAPKAEILTNASIVDLAKSGLGDDVILTKIEHSTSNFDLSSTALIALKNQNVDNQVIKAMMNKTNGEPTDVKKQPVTETHALPADAVENLNYPYYFDKPQNTCKPIEKTTAAVRVKKKMLGYGGVNFLYETNGAKSLFRVSAQDDLAFIINTGGNPLPELVLYKLKIDGDKRDAISLEYKTFGATKAPDNVSSYNTSAIKPGMYKLTVAQKLLPGEYFFAGKAATTASSIDVFAFGID